jgi:nucleoside-diphosphate-sugar epimerase
MGRRAGMVIEGAAYHSGDVTDYVQVRHAVEGMEAVVHLAAVRHPSLAPGQEVFRVNGAGTFNIYQAAAEVGIRRVVSASSINALGYNFGIKEFPLLYFPMDEEHPTYTTDPYSFSKRVVEEIAAYFYRREGISGVLLRLPAVYEVQGEAVWIQEALARIRAAYDALLSMPEAARRQRVKEIITKFEAMRTKRVWEYPADESIYQDAEAMLAFGRSNFWASIDARDSAQAIEKALLADYEGSHPLFINDSHNFVGIDSHMLAETFFPEVTTWKRAVQGTESLVSIDKARQLIGFKPEYSPTSR